MYIYICIYVYVYVLEYIIIHMPKNLPVGKSSSKVPLGRDMLILREVSYPGSLTTILYRSVYEAPFF